MFKITNERKEDFEKIDAVKKYFARIFTVLSTDIRKKLIKLKIPKDEKKEINKELAFLPIEKQKTYLKELEKEEKI